MSNAKRPILLQIRSFHDSTNGSTQRRNCDGLDDTDSAAYRDAPQTPTTCANDRPDSRPEIRRRRPLKTQSMVLPSPSCDVHMSDDFRASVPAKFEDHLQYYSNQIETNPSDRFSTSSADSSSASTTSSSSSSSSSSNDSADAPSLILPYLYVGDQAQTQLDTISSLNISYILSLQSLPKFLSSSPVKPAKTSSQEYDDKIISESDCDEIDGSLNRNSPQDVHLDNSQSSLKLYNNGRYDIIDGGDGGLLPSANSSKDYLVKIKPTKPPIGSNDGDGNGEESEDEQSTGLEQSTLSRHDDEQLDPSKSSRTSALGKATNCDNTFTTTSREVCDNRPSKRTKKNNLSDDELNDENTTTAYSKQSHLSQIADQHVADGEHPSTDPAGCQASSSSASRAMLACRLKQRCNRLSSSVHRLIRGKCINISDTFEQLLDKFFDETHNFIEEARRNKCNVLVHCKAGISRSPTIAIAYLMKWKRLHLQDAYSFVKRCRPQISPNLNFMGQLVSYERQLRRDPSHLPSPTSCCLLLSSRIGQPSAIGSLPIDGDEQQMIICDTQAIEMKETQEEIKYYD